MWKVISGTTAELLLGGGVWLEDVSHQGRDLKGPSPPLAPLPFCFLAVLL